MWSTMFLQEGKKENIRRKSKIKKVRKKKSQANSHRMTENSKKDSS